MNTRIKKLSTVFGKLNQLYRFAPHWTRHSYQTVQPGKKRAECYCLAGGLAKVQGEDPHSGEVIRGYAELFGAIKDYEAANGNTPLSSTVEEWNDRPYRTIGDVRAVVALARKNARRAERVAA